MLDLGEGEARECHSKIRAGATRRQNELSANSALVYHILKR